FQGLADDGAAKRLLGGAGGPARPLAAKLKLFALDQNDQGAVGKGEEEHELFEKLVEKAVDVKIAGKMFGDFEDGVKPGRRVGAEDAGLERSGAERFADDEIGLVGDERGCQGVAAQ